MNETINILRQATFITSSLYLCTIYTGERTLTLHMSRSNVSEARKYRARKSAKNHNWMAARRGIYELQLPAVLHL